MKIAILSSLLLLSASLGASPIVHEFKNPSFSGREQAPLLDHRKPRTFKKEAIEEALNDPERTEREEDNSTLQNL